MSLQTEAQISSVREIVMDRVLGYVNPNLIVSTDQQKPAGFEELRKDKFTMVLGEVGVVSVDKFDKEMLKISKSADGNMFRKRRMANNLGTKIILSLNSALTSN